MKVHGFAALQCLALLQLDCSSSTDAPTNARGGSAGQATNNAGTGATAATGSGGGSTAGARVDGAVGGSASSGSAGTTAASGTPGSFGGVAGMPGGTEVPDGYEPALIGVGYGGLRIVSRDGGMTWGDRASFKANGGDDQDLLRAVVYGKGLWIATGWKLVTSSNGKTWTDHGLINENDFMPCNVVEGLAYAADWFYAASSETPAVTYRSKDGLSWSKHGTIGTTQGHLFLTHRGDEFVAYGDNQTSFHSTDAATFSELFGISEATYCADGWRSLSDCFDASWFDGFYFRTEWQGKIARSQDGDKWVMVHEDDQKNTLYRARAVAAGFVAP